MIDEELYNEVRGDLSASRSRNNVLERALQHTKLIVINNANEAHKQRRKLHREIDELRAQLRQERQARGKAETERDRLSDRNAHLERAKQNQDKHWVGYERECHETHRQLAITRQLNMHLVLENQEKGQSIITLAANQDILLERLLGAKIESEYWKNN